MDSDSLETAANALNLPCVDPDPDIKADGTGVRDGSETAQNGARGAIEGREEAVASPACLGAAEPGQLGADDGMVPGKQRGQR